MVDVAVGMVTDVVVWGEVVVEVARLTVVDVVAVVDVVVTARVVVVCAVVVVVAVGPQSESNWCASSAPWGWPLNDQCEVALTECVPGPGLIVIVSVASGPWKVKVFWVCCRSMVIDSFEMTVVSGKFVYANVTCVHEIEIWLVCADAVGANNASHSAAPMSWAPKTIAGTPRNRPDGRVRCCVCGGW